MKKFILCALFLLVSCVSAEERGFRKLVNSVDAHARPMRWVDEDVFMMNGMILDWPLPPDAVPGECLLLIASPRSGRIPRMILSVSLDWGRNFNSWETGAYRWITLIVPLRPENVSVFVTSMEGDGNVDLSAYRVSNSACRRSRTQSQERDAEG